MKSLKRLRAGCRKLYQGARKILGIQVAQPSLDVRNRIFSQLESAVSVENNQKIFPYKSIKISLLPPSKSIAREFKNAFMESSRLKSDLYRMLKDARIQVPHDLQILVDLKVTASQGIEKSGHSRLYEMEFDDPVDSTKYEIPQAVLEVVKGSAEQGRYRITKDRMLVGGLSKVQDREGRLVRINDVVFTDTGNEVNATVSAMHARIWFDFKQQEFRVMDESSFYGTRIVREGNTIDVPAENPVGIGLRPGDEIYFGQACLRLRMIRKGHSESGKPVNSVG